MMASRPGFFTGVPSPLIMRSTAPRFKARASQPFSASMAAYIRSSASAACSALPVNMAAFMVDSSVGTGQPFRSFVMFEPRTLRNQHSLSDAAGYIRLWGTDFDCPVSFDMAGSLVNSSAGTGQPFLTFVHYENADPFRLVGGGVPRSKLFTRADLEGAISQMDSPSDIELSHMQYELVEIRPSDWTDVGEDHSPRGTISLPVPLDMLIPKLDVPSLRDLCQTHNINVTSRNVRVQLEQWLRSHHCNEKCEDARAVLRPYEADVRSGPLDLFSPALTDQIKMFSVDQLLPFLSETQATVSAIGFRIKQVSLDADAHTDPSDIVIQNLPLTDLVPHLSVAAMHAFATHHKIRMLKKWKKEQCADALKQHQCTSCRTLYFIVTPLQSSARSRAPPSWIDDGSTPFLWDSDVQLSTDSYPPRPTTLYEIATAMKGYCEGLAPDVIEEVGCCVCGRLTRRSDTMAFNENTYQLSLLDEIDCTREERRSKTDPIRPFDEPILDSSLNAVCLTCHDTLTSGRRPRMALANHLWVGDVPDCLKDLTLAEMAMVTRVRYNRCVVRISSGHAKMTANVIAFEHPTTKIYQRLPMPRQDLDDVLAVLYTGHEPPSDDDLRRTPVLVRRNRVKRALEWLKLNHKDYGDLEIDYATLSSYPLEHVAVGVYYKNIDAMEGNVPDAAKSVFDNTVEEGTAIGPCPYTVHGLTAERYTSMTTTQRKLAAVQQLKNGGKLLAIGHDTVPQSIFSNPRLYPQMFPWLFPYGLGGLDLDQHAGKISRESHIKWLMMYHDKRFQRDAGFLIVLFNHQLIRQSSHGTFMMAKRSNFGNMVDTIHQLDPGVLRIISKRLINGGRAYPQTPEEQKAFRMFDQIEYVGNRVSGSMSKKKYQRGEVWSLINFMNAPAWFITVSPADNKHPLCIHWAGEDVDFKPEIKNYEARKLMITRNPVACARFFHHLVLLFIKHLCGWTDEGPKRGVFGRPAAFYGTVEQQGRMTLHLHFLLWIQGQLSLNEVREKLTADSAFAKEIGEYIESCMVGGFSTGTKDEVEARVPREDDYEDRGIHTILQSKAADTPAGYVNPTLTLPESPPREFCKDVEFCGCDNCGACREWYERFKTTLDDILLRSNVHQCFDRLDNEAQGEANPDKSTEPRDTAAPTATESAQENVPGKKSKKRLKTAKVTKAMERRKPRRHATAKGCINKNGQCTARFPREVFMRTMVDPKTGHLSPKHTESSINDVSPAVTVGNRCNTDSRFLMSGTAVKATVGYVTDYITKAWMKTYQVFSSMYDTFNRHGSILDDESKDAGHSARQMILKVVNSLSSKMEIGAPMAALYLLGNPDHYTSHQFVPFYWKNYVSYVQGEWKALDTLVQADDLPLEFSREDREDVGVSRSHGTADNGEDNDVDKRTNADCAPLADLQAETLEDEDIDMDSEHPLENHSPVGHREDENVRLTREGNFYMAKSNTDDYKYRPAELEQVCLYEFIQCAVKYPMRCSRAPRKDLRFFRLQSDHPQADTHVIACDPERRYLMVPNFLGPQIPRRDVGDREDYCCTMLTLFKPWRTGIDLKAADSTWEETFGNHAFSTRAKDLMNNFNVRYECYDARDDFSAMFKSASGEPDDDDEDTDSVFADDADMDGQIDDDEDLSCGVGPATQGIQNANATMFNALRNAGWSSWNKITDITTKRLNLPKIAIDEALHSTAWRNIVKVAKQRAWRRKLSAMSAGNDNEIPTGGRIKNEAFVVPSSYLSKDFMPSEKKWSEVMTDVIQEFNLNKEQIKAFRIVANHACEIAPDQLLMHLGGMAGTGKSTVIRALTAFFISRKEPYRFVLLGPTGTSAALIGGSTYHSFLGLNTGSSSCRTSVSAMEEVKERLTGVGYLLIDEQSMLNCRQLCAISARCCDALGIYERPFGGLNVILCGDFAQLPPPKGYSLYSREVSVRQSPRQTVHEQENTIGKLIWLQFTTAVILKENMRQIDNVPEEIAFQDALLNLRWHNCTEDDIALFKSRIPSSSNGLSVDSDGFKNVSVITARNRDKDHLNTANSARFASETGEKLHDFYSSDKMLSAPSTRDPTKRGRIYSQAKTMSKKMQASLWQQPPCTSENVPGKLSLSIGMPILIRHNEATELCMTRGQEARVVGWSSMKLPNHPDRRSLDVLYAELIKPPHPVKLPHLPKNVVPLTKISQPVDARLVNDEWVHISRSQVPILPNFAMTDYSSQGKTRQWNVVDLTECRNFQAAYTCLSRGTKISQTVILRDFDESKLKGELDGELRQEYRELDSLATITDLRYRGIFQLETAEATRWTVIESYRAWLKRSAIPDSADPYPTTPDEEQRAQDIPAIDFHTLDAKAKRKAATEPITSNKKRKTTRGAVRSSVWESPAGPVWDSEDHSCAFDTWTFVLHSIWASDKPRWSRPREMYGPFFNALIDNFQDMPMDDPEIEVTAVRDRLRENLRSTHPLDYPEGTRGVDIMALTGHLVNDALRSTSSTSCTSCNARLTYRSDNIHCLSRFYAARSAASIQAAIDSSDQRSVQCSACGMDVCLGRDIGDILTFHVAHSDGILLNSRIEVDDMGTYRLAGVIYYDSTPAHFVSRAVQLDNKVYSHDGMDGAYSIYEGILDKSFPIADLNELKGAKASLAIYVLVNRRPLLGPN